jgi:hypothetical protein
MEQRVLEILGNNHWMWMEDLKSHFLVCDLKTRCVLLIPEFQDAIAHLCSLNKIQIAHRLEVKGYYKRFGEIIQNLIRQNVG